MNHLTDLIKSFELRTEALRTEIIEAIIKQLKDNNIAELRLSQDPNSVAWVVWFNDESYGYDSRVIKIKLHGNGIAVVVYDQDCCHSETLTSDNCDLACTNIDWLIRIFNNTVYTLSLPKSEGVIDISGHKIEWLYEEPGLTELPESEKQWIGLMLAKGETWGDLSYNDNDVDFEGEWKIKTE